MCVRVRVCVCVCVCVCVGYKDIFCAESVCMCVCMCACWLYGYCYIIQLPVKYKMCVCHVCYMMNKLEFELSTLMSSVSISSHLYKCLNTAQSAKMLTKLIYFLWVRVCVCACMRVGWLAG